MSLVVSPPVAALVSQALGFAPSRDHVDVGVRQGAVLPFLRRAPGRPPRRARDGEERVRRDLRSLDEGARELLGGGGRGHPLGEALGSRLRRQAPALLPLVRRRRPEHMLQRARPPHRPRARQADRKSTRLNSSHSSISYAVFCLKKKKK